MDAITVLREDHRRVEQLFKRFEKTGAGATKTKRKLADQIIEELSVHASIEEQVLYPAMRKAFDRRKEETVLEALEEHHAVKQMLMELERMPADHERFTAKAKVIIENVRTHVKEEEGDLFPRLRKAMKPAELRELGEALQTARKAAPTRPHPKAPDEPPANLIAGPASAVLDAGVQVVRSVRGRKK